MKILLLGANGFVGRNILGEFNKTSHEVISSSRSYGIDLLDEKSTTEFINQTRPNFIINCAAHVGSLNYVSQMAADIVRDNSRINLNLYEAVSKASRSSIIINPIANCAFPAKAETFIEDNLWDGQVHRTVLAYGASRRHLMAVAESYSMQFGIKTVNLLVPNMYGPMDSTDPNKSHALNALISRFVKAEYQQQKEITLWGTGIAIREWLYAADLGVIIRNFIEKNMTIGFAEPVNIAQNFGLSVRELAEIINAHFSNHFTINWDISMPDGAPKKVMDDRKFRKLFPEFKFRDMATGIEKTIEYYRTLLPY